MKITIKHDQNSIDPNATCSDEQFESVIDSLTSAVILTRAITH